MISSTDSCRQLVAGNYDVILNEPTAFKTVLTDFLDRCEQYENDLLAHQQQQQQHAQNNANSNNDSNNNNNNQNPAPVAQDGSINPSVRGYVNEFRMLKELSKVLKKDTATYHDGLEPHNRSKNRYGDIIPFNHTRVILSCNPQYQRPITAHNGNHLHLHHQQLTKLINPTIVGSDYINANYIRGPSGSPRTYIASQGPLPSTLNDFWRMIWECNVSVIVMACNEHELGLSKCELYWPEQLETSQVYGNIQVTLMRVRQVNSDFLIRKFSVKYLEPLEAHEDCATTATTTTSGDSTTSVRDASSTASSDSCVSVSDDSMATSSTTCAATNHDRTTTACNVQQQQQSRRVLMEKSVVQFHIASWPDHGVPDSVQPILELVRLVREVQPFEHTPILVHCSAGCGRTGTICCIDYVYGLMRMGKLDANFDLFNIIGDMRRQRMAMVQTLEQYILCHRAVASLFMQQLQLLGHNYYQEPLSRNHNQRRAVCDAKLALAGCGDGGGGGGGAQTEGQPDDQRLAATREGPRLDTSNETSENSYKLYQNHHETSSSADEQQTNSDFQEEDEDDEEEDEEEDLGPVFI